jgi:hypothetical protein
MDRDNLGWEGWGECFLCFILFKQCFEFEEHTHNKKV